MKKYLTIAGIGIATLVFVYFFGRYVGPSKNNQSIIYGDYLGSDYKGNYVWGGAMNLAWNELNESILKQKLQLKTGDTSALEMVSKLNDAPFSKSDLDEESYYIKSGYGQNTVVEINRESRKKFPTKSFADLQLVLGPGDIISYAYFLKEVEYKTKFGMHTVLFNGQKVKGFGANDFAQSKNVKIIKYVSDDKFLIKLQLKDSKDELILAKGYDMKNPQSVVSEINENNNTPHFAIDILDTFRAPKLHLDHRREYGELIGRYLANSGFADYFIGEMFENIKFDMDEKGARVENEAAIALSMSMGPKPKHFILDKPYWIVMKRADSQNPYFILGVNNVELMEVE